MKTIIVLIAFLASVATASAQYVTGPTLPVPMDPAVPLSRIATLPSSTYTNAFKDNTGWVSQYGYYWKYWASPKLWSAVDTTEAFSLGRIKDTIFAYYVKSGGTIYHGLISVQFGNAATGAPIQWRTAVSVDSIGRTGATPGWKHGVGDSVVVGRSLWFIRNKDLNAGCNVARLLIAKDTANCSAAGQLYSAGFLVKQP